MFAIEFTGFFLSLLGTLLSVLAMKELIVFAKYTEKVDTVLVRVLNIDIYFIVVGWAWAVVYVLGNYVFKFFSIPQKTSIVLLGIASLPMLLGLFLSVLVVLLRYFLPGTTNEIGRVRKIVVGILLYLIGQIFIGYALLS